MHLAAPKAPFVHTLAPVSHRPTGSLKRPRGLLLLFIAALNCTQIVYSQNDRRARDIRRRAGLRRDEGTDPGPRFCARLLRGAIAAWHTGCRDTIGTAGNAWAGKGPLELVGDAWSRQATGDAVRVYFLI